VQPIRYERLLVMYQPMHGLELPDHWPPTLKQGIEQFGMARLSPGSEFFGERTIPWPK